MKRKNKRQKSDVEGYWTFCFFYPKKERLKLLVCELKMITMGCKIPERKDKRQMIEATVLERFSSER